VADSVEGWEVVQNLEPFVRLLALLIGSKLFSKEYDWFAIQYGLQDTDVHEGRWYSYPLGGSHAVILDVSHAPDASEDVNIRVTSAGGLAPELTAQVELLDMVCQEFMLISQH
jgi:hypothetical protein